MEVKTRFLDDSESVKTSSLSNSSNSLITNHAQNYKARFWGQMLDTLKRTIDQLYAACEADESEVECKEIIMLLSYSTRDFQSLIDKMEILKKKSFNDRRPLAWDERKMSIDSPLVHKSSCTNSPRLSYSLPPNSTRGANAKARTPTNDEHRFEENNNSHYQEDEDQQTSTTDYSASENYEETEEEFNDDLDSITQAIEKMTKIERSLAKELKKARDTKRKLLEKCNSEVDLFAEDDDDDPDEAETASVSTINFRQCCCAELCAICSSMLVAKSRIPGRTVEIHEKLLSRQKYLASSQTKESLDEKQERADQLRKKNLAERTLKLQDLTKRVEKARSQKHFMCSKKKSMLNSKLSAAEAKRRAQLQKIIHKAHDEETKGREIAFIQSLEAEQKQHSIFLKHQESQARLQDLEEERRRRLERKQELEEAAKLRRCEMEAQRRAKLDARLEKWKWQTDTLVTKSATMKERAQHQEQVRLEKIAHLEVHSKLMLEKLRLKIAKKSRDSERRKLEQLRNRKAFEQSVQRYSTTGQDGLPTREQYAQRKWCTACQVMIDCDLSLNSHLQGYLHQTAIRRALETGFEPVQVEQFNLQHLVEAEPNQKSSPRTAAYSARLQAMRGQVKKLMHRMHKQGRLFLQKSEISSTTLSAASNGEDYFEQRPKLISLIREAKRYINLPDSASSWAPKRVQALDKCLNAIIRIVYPNHCHNPPDLLQSINRAAVAVVLRLGLLNSLMDVLVTSRFQSASHNNCLNPASRLPEKSLTIACSLIRILVENSTDSVYYMLRANHITTLVLLLMQRFQPGLHLRSNDDVDGLFRQQPVCSRKKNTMTHSDDHHGTSNCRVSTDIVRCITMLLISLRRCHERALTAAQDSSVVTNFDLKLDLEMFHSLVLFCMKSGFLDQIARHLASHSNSVNVSDKTSVLFNSSLLEFIINFVEIVDESLGPSTVLSDSSPEWSRDPKVLLCRIMTHTDVFGIIPLLYSFVFHRSSISNSDITGTLDLLTLSALRLLNKLAELDRVALQSVLGDEVLCLELRHIICHTLQQAEQLKQLLPAQPASPASLEQPSQKKKPSSEVSLPTRARRVVPKTTSELQLLNCIEKTFDSMAKLQSVIWNSTWLDRISSCDGVLSRQELLTWLVVEAICLLGAVTCQNGGLQSALAQAGTPPTLLQRIVRMPLQASFSQESWEKLLYPTLIACCHENKVNTEVLSLELDVKLLARFIASRGEQVTVDRFSLEARFPRHMWTKAEEYFTRQSSLSSA